VRVPSWRRKLKRIRNFIELKESITCPDCWSENIVIDDIDETFECLTCLKRGDLD
jgi:transcription elongation factor Elf1